MTFDQWLYETMTTCKPNSIRMGQHLWNQLSSAKFDLTSHIADHKDVDALDPFYVDSRIPTFLEYVKENWDKY